MNNKIFKDFFDFIKASLDFKEKSDSFLKKEAIDEMDNFILICFSDLLGIPNPIEYYSLELLPYIASDLEGFEIRILNRKSVIGDRWGDFCC
ncbi:hypothetical protein WG909_14810 [Peptostreptococcaceae bacterium AGR-M142]